MGSFRQKGNEGKDHGMTPQRNDFRPTLEGLEDRMTLSASVNGYGNLVITGSDYRNDSVTVQQSSYADWYWVTENGYSQWHYVPGGNVSFSGGDGHDYFNNYS